MPMCQEYARSALPLGAAKNVPMKIMKSYVRCGA